MSETLPPLYFALFLPAGFFGGLIVHYMWTVHTQTPIDSIHNCTNCLFSMDHQTCARTNEQQPKSYLCDGWEEQES